MDESDQMMVDADELTGLVAEEHRTEEKPTVTDVEPAGDAAVEDSGISPFILDVA